MQMTLDQPTSDPVREQGSAQKREQRAHFAAWLKRHPKVAREDAFEEIIAKYSRPISKSAAYRVAVKLGLRGRRFNATRYDAFWDMINWRLPDSAISTIWGVMRGNVRQRRVRLAVGEPVYDARLHRRNPQFQQEVADETRRSAEYSGPRPR